MCRRGVWWDRCLADPARCARASRRDRGDDRAGRRLSRGLGTPVVWQVIAPSVRSAVGPAATQSASVSAPAAYFLGLPYDHCGQPNERLHERLLMMALSALARLRPCQPGLDQSPNDEARRPEGFDVLSVQMRILGNRPPLTSPIGVHGAPAKDSARQRVRIGDDQSPARGEHPSQLEDRSRDRGQMAERRAQTTPAKLSSSSGKRVSSPTRRSASGNCRRA